MQRKIEWGGFIKALLFLSPFINQSILSFRASYSCVGF